MAVSVGAVVANLYYSQPLLPDLAREFELSVTGAGAIAMLAMAGAGIAQLIFVPLGDIRNRRRMILGMIGAAALMLALNATAQNAAWFMAATFFLGMTASVNHVTVPFAASLAPPQQRGRIVGTVISGLLIGMLLARTWAGWIGEMFGWRVVFGIGAVFMLILLVLLYRALPDQPPASPLTWPELLSSMLPLWRELPELRQAVVVNSLMFCVFGGFWTAMVFFVEGPPYFYTSRGAGLFSLIGVAGALCAPFAGRFTDRSSGTWNRPAAVGAMMLAFLVLGAFGRNLAALIAGIVLLDVSMQFSHVTNQARIFGLVPEARSRLNTIYMTCSFTGGALGSYLSAWWWTRAGWWGVCGYSLGVLLIALAGWWWMNGGLSARRQRAPSGSWPTAASQSELKSHAGSEPSPQAE